MMKQFWLYAAACWATAVLNAQEAITPDVLRKLQAEETASVADKALRNAMARTAISVLASDVSSLQMGDTHFTYEVPVRSITDQQSSGRCWLFTGMNVLRHKAVQRHNLKDLELSQVYLFFWDQLEKSNLFLQSVIDTRKQSMDDRLVDWLFQNPLSDGGTFCGVYDLARKYGVVPREVMPETYSANHTAQISMLLKWKLREMALCYRKMHEEGKSLKEIEARKIEDLKTVYHILTLAYGIPPASFSWTQRDTRDQLVSIREYTPQEFYQTFMDADAEYVMVMNDPLREYYKVYEIEYDRHTYDGRNWVYLNLPADEIKPLGIASLRDTTAMYFSCDVGKYFNRDNGTLDLRNFDYGSLLGTSFNMNKRERILTHASASSHAMTLIGVDVDTLSGKVAKWEIENSWGKSSGWNGKLVMTDEWFDEYMFRLVINTKYVPQKYLDMYRQKPIRLPAWDPLFASGDE